MIEVPYLFTTLLAHYLVLKLDNRRSIKSNDLINFRSILFQKYLEQYKKYGDTVIGEKWEGELRFTPVNDYDEILDLIKKYPDIFYFKDGTLFIYETIDLDFLNRLMAEQFGSFRHKFYNVSEYKAVRNSLGIIKIYELADIIKTEVQKIEKQLEEAYNNLDSSKILINSLLLRKFVLLMNILTNYPIFIKEYKSLLDSDEKLGEYITEGYDYIRNSNYGENNEPYPIDDELYRKSDFYEDIESLTCTIQECVDDIYQYAIFGTGSLYQQRINEMLMQFNIQDFLEKFKVPNLPEDGEDLDFEKQIELYEKTIEKEAEKLPEDGAKTVKINFNAIEEEFTFWLTYLYKLNEYLKNHHDENLIKVKQRLLYLLDDISKKLYIEENFESVFAKITEEFFSRNTSNVEETEWQGDEGDTSTDDVDNSSVSDSDEEEIPYGHLGWESEYLIYDCFLGREYKTIEKLLLIATYYFLTEDQNIIYVLNQFKEHPKYSEYEAIIAGRGYTGRNFSRSKKLT